jgi:hypothetical protein
LKPAAILSSKSYATAIEIVPPIDTPSSNICALTFCSRGSRLAFVNPARVKETSRFDLTDVKVRLSPVLT